MRARTICIALGCALVAFSAPADSAFAARRATQQQRRQRPVKKVTAPRPQRRQVPHHELNAFLRSPAGKAKFKVYKQQAFDAPRQIANRTGEKPFTSLRHQHQAYKTAGRLTKIATYATSVVTGTMGAFFGQFLHMAGGGGGGPPSPDAYQHPSVLHFLSPGHMLIGAVIGAGAVLAGGTMIAIKFKRAAKRVDRQAGDEAVARILAEMELGMENEPPGQHPAFEGQAAGGRGGRGNRDILNDLWGGPGALFGPVESAADRASHSSGISDVGPSGFDSLSGQPGGPP